MTDQPVAGGEHAAGFQHAENVGKQRILVGHVEQCVLGEHQVEHAVGKRQFARWRLDEIDPAGKASFSGAATCIFNHRQFDVEAGRVPGGMLFDKMQRDAARAAANVEDAFARQREPMQHAVDFLRPAGRKIALAPQRFEKADCGIVVLRPCAMRIDHQQFPMPKFSKAYSEPQKMQHSLLNIHSI